MIEDFLMIHARAECWDKWCTRRRCYDEMCEPVDHLPPDRLREIFRQTMHNDPDCDSREPTDEEARVIERKVKRSSARCVDEHWSRINAWLAKTTKTDGIFDVQSTLFRRLFGLDIWTLRVEELSVDRQPSQAAVAYLILLESSTQIRGLNETERGGRSIERAYEILVKLSSAPTGHSIGRFDRALGILGITAIGYPLRPCEYLREGPLPDGGPDEGSSWPRLMLLMKTYPSDETRQSGE